MYSLPATNVYYAYKVSFRIEVEEGRNIGGTFKFCSDIIYNWIKHKFSGLNLPDKKQTVHKNLVSQSVDVLCISNERYFCMKTVHQDTSALDRFWITEAEIMDLDGELILGVRNSYTASSPEHNLHMYGIPRFVRKIQEKCVLKDGKFRTGYLHNISSEEDLEKLFDLVTDSTRLLPVIIVAQHNRATHDYLEFSEVDGYLIDGVKLARKLELRAHVFYLPLNFQESWTELVGEEWCVYNGAVRTYNPNARFDESEYYAHPYTLPTRILAMEYITSDDKICVGGRAFRHILTHRIEDDNAFRRIEWGSLKHKFYFNKYMDLYRKGKPNEGSNEEKEYYKELDIENDQLREEVNELNKKISIVEGDLEQVRNENQKFISMNYANQSRIRSLEKQLEELKGRGNVIEYPTDYSQIPQWVETNFSGRILLSKRALKALKKAEYREIELVGKALELLASEYYDMRLGIGDKATYDAKRSQLHLEDSGAITDIAAGEQGEEYYILYKGQNRKMDRHLAKGDSRDPRDCLRIYYFWDDEADMVIIGSLPNHLDIRSSN